MRTDSQHEPPLEFAEAIEMFFMPPTVELREGWVSTLYLCRRELQDCLIGKIVDESELLEHRHHRLFATALVALSGIELLATVAPNISGNRRTRFITFLTNYSATTPLAMTEESASVLLDFRNALSHTFGLFHLGEGGEIVRIYLIDQNAETPVVREREDGYEVFIDSLVEVFLYTAYSLRSALQADDTLASAFVNNVMAYGRIYFRGPHIA